MSDNYVSIREDVLRKLERELPYLQKEFDIETIGIFGSVSRGEDTPESDIDVLYTFRHGAIGIRKFLDLFEYLENLLGRRVELVLEKYLSPYIRPYVLADVVMYSAGIPVRV
ncbi:DNA polymerase beta domain protein region [Methanolacinia petrolearia DSM 11571]|uniref:protein adenylyltransferase n=1 Tax=Methanolacinia petrolearia (strain DSM 11571 / OCM 486 / SEBR 4847) TaxID=679926 RepID=E1RD22_METP4|nr:nucleotidyltransferase domain-containing protein [Methanolacinia petrolearia]ADN35922.1 DNA polymerase beta domain protein region [Methanolacinia petrolearia DSM 11571]